MTHVYIVRCNFTEPAKEQAWNAWYSGPKIKQMLSQPHFLTGQRFRRETGTGRDYLALWTVSTPEALRTRQYTAQWGFAEWLPYITDWSRDLFDAGDRPASAFAVELGGELRVISFDGMEAVPAESARETAAATETNLMWLPVAGLDRHTPLIGLCPLADTDTIRQHSSAIAQAAIYRPISDVYSA